MTVATGVVTATVVFSKDLDQVTRWLALAAWVVLTFSVVFGIFVLFNISGALNAAANDPKAQPSFQDRGIRTFSLWQFSAFLLGLPLIVAFGFFAATAKTSETKPTPITVTCVTPPTTAPAVSPPSAALPKPSQQE